MRLASTLLAAALAAVAVAHEWQGDKDWEREDRERKGHPVGQFGGNRGHGFKEASWWEKLQGNGPEHRKHDHGHHGHMHHPRDPLIPGEVQPDDGDWDHKTKHEHEHHHHGGKHQGAHHPGQHHHGHKAEHHHHHHHKGPHAGAHKGTHTHKGEHAHKGHDKGAKPWHKLGWFSGPSHEILPREASEPIETHDGFPAQHTGHKGAHGHHHGEHHPGHHHKGEHHNKGEHHHKGEHYHKVAHPGGHKGGYEHVVWGEHPHNEHTHFHEGIGHHKPEGFASPHFARDGDTDEVGPDNDFFYSTDFDDDDDDFDDDDDDDEDETPNVYSRDVNDVEQTADPNEISGDEDYYKFGDDGDDDILEGKLTDSPDDDDDDEDLTEADLDDDDEDDEDDDDDDDDADEGADDDDDEDDLSTPEKLKRWAEVKKHGKHHHPKPAPKKGWGIFPW